MEPLDPAFQAQVRREALSIRTDAILGMELPGQRQAREIPMIWVNADTRPEVRDLWQLHERHGEGDQEVRWLFLFDLQHPEDTAFYLDIQVKIPKCPLIRYFVAFPLIEQEDLVERLSRAEQFSIITEPWPTWKEHQPASGQPLVITPDQLSLLRRGTMYEAPDDRGELRRMLNEWRRLMGRKKR